MIVGVHGIWNYSYYRSSRDATVATAAISSDWTAWLREGLTTARGKPDDAPVRVAYYAHHLHRGTAQGADITQLDEDAQTLLTDWVELLREAPVISQGTRTIRARAAVDWLTAHYGEPARRFAMIFAREVSSYLKTPNGRRRLAARDAVAETIRTAARQDEAVTVVAHSLGSVVVYEALWAHPELRVDRLVTLGSPLGMPGVVFDRLDPAPGSRGSRPPGVSEWINLADIGDLVAVPRTGLSSAFDGVVSENPALTIAKWDFHTVRSYLSCADVAAVTGTR
ncbi:alpha/beta hydrolase [Nonomuraea sp. B12E4]|uniref:alpha/beta hydrolase n=1 Tax=Nonomuraea sp. B12E4 TaxID=3153564 RepID=UPI00325F158E